MDQERIRRWRKIMDDNKAQNFDEFEDLLNDVFNESGLEGGLSPSHKGSRSSTSNRPVPVAQAVPRQNQSPWQRRRLLLQTVQLKVSKKLAVAVLHLWQAIVNAMFEKQLRIYYRSKKTAREDNNAKH